MELNWYLLFVKKNWEKKIAQILTRKKIENYYPLHTSDTSNDKKKIIGQPLIPSHIFVRATKGQHILLKKLPGIINFVYWLGEPVIVKDQEINLIKRFLSEYSNVRLEKISVNSSESGKIINHSFNVQDTQVISLETKKVKAILPSLGFTLIAEVEPTKIRVISPSKKRMSGTNIIQRIRTASKQFAGYY